MLAAASQNDYMTAMVGNPKLFRECKSFFPCGTPMSTGAGGEAMVADLDKAKAYAKKVQEMGFDADEDRLKEFIQKILDTKELPAGK